MIAFCPMEEFRESLTPHRRPTLGRDLVVEEWGRGERKDEISPYLTLCSCNATFWRQRSCPPARKLLATSSPAFTDTNEEPSPGPWGKVHDSMTGSLGMRRPTHSGEGAFTSLAGDLASTDILGCCSSKRGGRHLDADSANSASSS